MRQNCTGEPYASPDSLQGLPVGSPVASYCHAVTVPLHERRGTLLLALSGAHPASQDDAVIAGAFVCACPVRTQAPGDARFSEGASSVMSIFAGGRRNSREMYHALHHC